MRFWDTSAIVPLLVEEVYTPLAEAWLSSDPELVVSWIAEIEVASALNRRKREGTLTEEAYLQAQARLARLKDSWHEVLPTEAVRHHALRFLQLYPIRTLDALQMGALWVFAEGDPTGIILVSLDARLAQAAEQEGFTVLTWTPS